MMIDMIVDIHAHAFPPLSEASGYDSSEEHLKYIQRQASSSTHMRFQGELPGSDEEVQFKVGRYGKLEWIKDDRKMLLKIHATDRS